MSTTPTTNTAEEATPATKPQTKPASKPKASKAAQVTKPKATTKPKTEAKTKAVAKPKTKVKTKTAKPTVAKAPKVKKPKLVRDSFTMPKDEYAAIQTLKTRSLALAQPAKKSELLRAGIKLLAGLSDKALLTALKAVPTLKTGRPAKS